MARKSNKTSHILNLLSGEGATAEEPEKESSQNPDFSGGNKDTTTTDIPTISIVDHLSNDDDPISNLIKENLESQVSLPPGKEPETEKEGEASAVENSSSSHEEMPVNIAEGTSMAGDVHTPVNTQTASTELPQTSFPESNELAATDEQDEGIKQEHTKEPVQQSVTQEPAANHKRNEEVPHPPSSGEKLTRTIPKDTAPVEQNTPSDVIQDTASTSHTPSTNGQEPQKAPHTVPRNGQDKDSSTADVHENPKALDSSLTVVHENQQAPNLPSGNEQNKTRASQASEQKSEEIKKEDKQPLATAPTPKKSLHYVNVMEHIVTERIVSFMESFQMCTCERCVTDATALTLTLLPAKYIVVDSYAESPLLNYYSNKFISQVTVEITKACNIVKNNPHH